MADYIESFLLGFAVTAMPGTVFFEVIRRTLANKSSTYKFLMGSFSGTFLIIGSVFLGVSLILTDESLAKLFYGLSALVLIYIGLTSALSKPTNSNIHSDRKHASTSSSFVAGFILGTANPISILFWVSIIGKMAQDHDSVVATLISSLMILIGALSVYAILIPLTSRSTNFLHAKNLFYISKFFGIIILGYGIFYLMKLA